MVFDLDILLSIILLAGASVCRLLAGLTGTASFAVVFFLSILCSVAPYLTERDRFLLHKEAVCKLE